MPYKKLSAIKIAEWARNQVEIIRISLGEYRGRNVVTLRTWRTKDGKEFACHDGITLDVKHVTKLAKAFKKARRRASKEGLI
jgi:hypothetical protein